MRRVCQLVLPSERFILMLAEGMVWKNLHSLEHPEVLEVLSKCPYVLFEVADAWDKDISEPERFPVIFKPLCCLESLLVASSCQSFMPFIVELLAVEKDEVCLPE